MKTPYKIFSIIILCLLSTGCFQKIRFSQDPAPYAPPQIPSKNKGLALVLGAGGAKGFAHLGVLEVLSDANIKPDVIIGCSAGSIVGALYAANPDTEALKDIMLSSKNGDVMALDIAEWPYSVYGKQKLSAYLEKHLKTQTFENLKIPLIIPATNLEFGNLTSFNSGDMIAPILASAACPGIFPPVKIHNQYFIDCGVADAIPVKLAKQLGFKNVIAVNVAGKLPDTSPNHVFGLLMRSIEITYLNSAKNSTEQADVVIDFDFKDIPAFSDEYKHYLYEEGKRATQQAMRKIKALLKKAAP